MPRTTSGLQSKRAPLPVAASAHRTLSTPSLTKLDGGLDYADFVRTLDDADLVGTLDDADAAAGDTGDEIGVLLPE